MIKNLVFNLYFENIQLLFFLINAHPYKGYLVANIDDFNNMELLSEKLGNKTFKTYYLYSKFNEEMQKKYEDEALLKNYKIEVHHPIIYITDGNKGI